MKADASTALDLQYWGLWAHQDGRLMVGYSGLVLILAAVSWVFAQLSLAMSYGRQFHEKLTPADDQVTVRRSARRYYTLTIALPAFLAMLLWIVAMGVGAQWIVGLAVFAGCWLGGVFLMSKVADRVPLVGAGAHLAAMVIRRKSVDGATT